MKVIEFMDEIVEAIEEFGKEAIKKLGAVLVIAAKSMIIITAPVWILPYCVLKDRNGGICENPDCNSCPFPPCEKEKKEND